MFMIKWLTAIISLLLLLVVLVFGPVGLKIAGAIAKHNLPGQLTYEKISGNLFGPITLTDASYYYQDSHIQAKNISFNWQSLSPIHITNLQIDNISIKQIKTKKEQTLKEWLKEKKQFFIKHEEENKNTKKKAFQLIVDHAQVNNLSFIDIKNKTTTHINNINFKAHITPKDRSAYLIINGIKPSKFTIMATMKGKPNQYTLDLQSKNRYGEFLLKGKGNNETLSLATDKSSLWKGSLTGTIKLDWEKPLSWSANLNADRLHINQWLPYKEAVVSFKLDAQGGPQQGNINLNKVIATINNESTKGSLQLAYQSNQIQQLSIKLNNPYGNVNIDGSYNDQINLSWQLAIKNLQKIIPDMPAGVSGTINSTGSIQGDIKQPVITGKIQTNNLNLFNYSLEKAEAEFNINLSKKLMSSFTLNATQLKTPHFNFKKIAGNLAGDGSKHALQLTLDGRNTETNLILSGKIEENTWKATIDNLTNTSKKFGIWQLKNSSTINLSDTTINLSKAICLVNQKNNGSACLNGKLEESNDWQASFIGQNIPLSIYRKFEKSDLHVSGDAKKLNISINGNKKQIDKAELLLNTNTGDIHYSKKDGTPIEFDFKNINYTINFSKSSGLTSTGKIQLNDKHHLNINLALPDYSGLGLPEENNKVSGSIQTKTTEMDWLTAIVTKSSDAIGQMAVNFKLSGTIKNPLLYGEAKLTGGGITLTHLGIKISKANITAKGVGNQLIYNGSAYSGSTVKVSGNTYLDKPELPTTINVDGNNLLIWNTDEYTVYANAKLVIATKPDGTHITGEVLVPKAYIHPYDFSGTSVLPSEIIYVNNGVPVDSDTSLVHNNIKITAGKDVRLDAIGIKGKVNGAITIIDKPQQVTYANGQLSLSQGTYSTFGKTLTIKRGSLNFNKSPLNNPYLNVLAIKPPSNTTSFSAQGIQTNNLTVGVELTGQLSRPKITLYSNNGLLSQPQILSYIITGSASTDASPGSIGLLLQALSTLKKNQGDQNSQNALGKLTQVLDFNELGTESNSTTDASGTQLQSEDNFVVGRYIGSRIYLRYLQGASDSNRNNTSFEARYYLKPNWFIQLSRTTLNNSTAISNGIDLLYTTEKQ